MTRPDKISTVTDHSVEKILVGSVKVPMGVIEESYLMIVDKYKATTFKKYTAIYQLCYLCKSLRMPSNVLIWACSTRLKKIIEPENNCFYRVIS